MYSKDELIQMLRDAADSAGLNPDIAQAQIQQESGFNPNAKSGAGAMGLAQFMPGTWAAYGGGGDPYNPVDAIAAYVRFMSQLVRQFNGRYDLALAGYNWGPNRSILKGWLSNGSAINFSQIPAETANYVKRILGQAGVTNFSKPVTTPKTTRPGRKG